jgi:Na+/H+ antiporter NhaD/arsenite permease-like protein
MEDDQTVKPGEAQDALDSVEEMQRAGFRRAIPPRWFGVGMSLIVAIGFALYTQDDPGVIPVLFIAIGTALLMIAARDKNGVIFGRARPESRVGFLAAAGVLLFFLALFFGGIFVKRAYDIPWAPLVTGLIAGVTILLLSESERRHYRAKSDENPHQ